jgi:uncharacterized protein (TIGR03066 family)
MKLLRVLVVGGILGTLAASASADEKIDPKALLGVWEMSKANTSSAKEGTLFEFKSGGVLILTLRQNDKEKKFEMTYKLDGAKLTTELKVSTGGKPRTSTITKLTDKELVWEESNGKTIELTRKK